MLQRFDQWRPRSATPLPDGLTIERAEDLRRTGGNIAVRSVDDRALALSFGEGGVSRASYRTRADMVWVATCGVSLMRPGELLPCKFGPVFLDAGGKIVKWWHTVKVSFDDANPYRLSIRSSSPPEAAWVKLGVLGPWAENGGTSAVYRFSDLPFGKSLFRDAAADLMSSHPVIILGNGPSANGLDLVRLGAPTIGMSGAYADWRAIDFRPTYYACLNVEEGPSHAEAIDQLVQENRVRRFLLRDNVCGLLGKSPRILNYDRMRAANPFFAVDPVSTGSHALLLAIALGYRLVGLAGVDIDRAAPPPADPVTSADQPASHASPPASAELAHDSRSPPGASPTPNQRQPETELQLQALRTIGQLAASAGVRVFNISDDSPLDQFPHLSLEDFRSLALRMFN